MDLFLVRYPEAPIPVPPKRGITIGRSADNDIVVVDPRVSRRHAAIRWERVLDAFAVVDLGSPNGTYFNGRRLPAEQPRQIYDRDKIRIASAVFTTRLVGNRSELLNDFRELRATEANVATRVVHKDELFAGHGAPPALAGRMEHLCPLEIFQMLQSAGKTGTLVLKSGDSEARFTISKGDVISGRFQDRLNADALYEAIKITSGDFVFTPQEAVTLPPEISVGTTALLLEGCRLLDQAGQESGTIVAETGTSVD